MPRWEYCTLNVLTRKVSDKDRQDLEEMGLGETTFLEIRSGETWVRIGTLIFLGSPDEAQPVPKVGVKIAELGRDGWELVSHIEVTTPTKAESYTFKRPLSE